MSLTKTLLVLVVLMVCGASAFAGGYQLNEHGARGMAMGGAYVAQASDGSAMYFNAAGLAFQSGFKIMLGGTMIMPSSTFKATSGKSTDMVSQTFTPVHAYLSYSFDNGLVVGVGVFNAYGLGSEWPIDWDGRQMSVKTDLTTWYINPTVAYKFSDQFAIGAGVSYVAASVKLSQRVPTLGSLAPLAPSAVDGTVALDGTGNSINWNVGLMYKPTKDLSIGVSYRSLTKVDFSGTAAFSGMSVLSSFFPGGTGTTTLPFPSDLFAGVAYNITKDFTVEADYQYVGWSSYDQLVLGLPTGPASPLGVLQKPSTLVKNWDNAYLIRVGAEYRMEKLALRAGFIYDRTPQPDAVVEPMLPDANRMEFTVGLGYDISKNVNVSACYQFISFSDRNGTIISKTALYPNIPLVAYPGAYSNSANLFSISLGFNY
jgi:long-chain fatty acid transport protein